jgi:hypothetical protein
MVPKQCPLCEFTVVNRATVDSKWPTIMAKHIVSAHFDNVRHSPSRWLCRCGERFVNSGSCVKHVLTTGFVACLLGVQE